MQGFLAITVISPRKSGSAEVTDFELGLGPNLMTCVKVRVWVSWRGVLHAHLSGDAYTTLALHQPNDITEEGTFKVASSAWCGAGSGQPTGFRLCP